MNALSLGDRPPRHRSSVEVQVWSVGKIVAAISGEGAERIFIPSFQRSFVWGTRRQNLLINSIKESRPVGSLLFYDDGIRNGKRQYQIVDGLQRATTLINYESKVFETFSPDEVDEEFVTDVLDHLDLSADNATQRSLAEKKTRNAVSHWVRCQRSFNAREGFRGSGLLEAIGERFHLKESDFNTGALRLCENFVEALRERLQISEYRIPVIVFSGDKSLLPDIFEQLNTTGVKLNKFDILASSWDGRLIRIELPALRAAINRRMDELSKESIGRQLGTAQRGAVELFHAVCGSGMVIAEHAPELFSTKKSWRPSEPLSCAFNITALSFAVPLSAMEAIPDGIERFSSPDDYFANIFAAVDETRAALQPIISADFEEASKSQTHSELQMASMVASIFRARIRSLDPRRSEADRARLLRQHYLWDALRRDWSGTGDSKAVNAVVQDRYMSPVSREAFVAVARAWHEEHLELLRTAKTRWIDVPALAFLRAYLYARGATARGPLQTKPIAPQIAEVVGNQALTVANVRIVDASGGDICQVGKLVDPPRSRPSGHAVREYLSTRFDMMLHGIISTFEFEPQA